MSLLTLAIQKSGRLSTSSYSLLQKSGLGPEEPNGRLKVPCTQFPLDLFLIRDDDIPGSISSGTCTCGIVGSNVLQEYQLEHLSSQIVVKRTLDFGACRLALAIPKDLEWNGPRQIKGLRIATSYPNILKNFLKQEGLEAEVVSMSGSVEAAPELGIADAICDIVSSGETLRMNGLKEVLTITDVKAVFICRRDQENSKEIERLCTRFDGVMGAENARYIMMNAKRSAVEAISQVAPGLSRPTLLPLAGSDEMVAIHMVARETMFWETLEKLRELGARDILVVPIEKMMA